MYSRIRLFAAFAGIWWMAGFSMAGEPMLGAPVLAPQGSPTEIPCTNCQATKAGPSCLDKVCRWLFYKPLVTQSSCCHNVSPCRPPLHAWFPCAPQVCCPGGTRNCNSAVVTGGVASTVTVVPNQPTAAPPAGTRPAETPKPADKVPEKPAEKTTSGPIAQASFKTGTLPPPVPIGPAKKISTYDPSKIAYKMPVLKPDEFRQPIKPCESCGGK